MSFSNPHFRRITSWNTRPVTRPTSRMSLISASLLIARRSCTSGLRGFTAEGERREERGLDEVAVVLGVDVLEEGGRELRKREKMEGLEEDGGWKGMLV